MTPLVLGLAVPALSARATEGDLWVSITLIFLVQLNYLTAPRIPVQHRF